MGSEIPAWLTTARLSGLASGNTAESAVFKENSTRTEWERDYDRLLFSAPVRRLADKTQVFPLDRNDSVRTRLTHSHEVSNLARSMGHHLIRRFGVALGFTDEVSMAIPVILASVGLAHDLGNPPFGHQGEVAIGDWFRKNDWVFAYNDKEKAHSLGAGEVHRRDEFLKFEGNAQTVRVLTRLQVSRDRFGLDLTASTLAAVMKYTVSCDGVLPKHEAMASNKKYGFFASEEKFVRDIMNAVSLKPGGRHPLVWIMEACDDIAYSILDVEDSIKKRLVSFHDLIAALRHKGEEANDPFIEMVLAKVREDQDEIDHGTLSPTERNDVSIQLFRARAISFLVDCVVNYVGENWKAIMAGTQTKPVLNVSECSTFVKCLKDFAFSHAYTHPSVLVAELEGRAAILDLMDWFWIGITDREGDELTSDRTNAFSKFIYQEISENYRRVFADPTNSDGEGRALSPRYREMRLLTDMISGMTDSYALETHARLKPHCHAFASQR